jgi:hypothetical protein
MSLASNRSGNETFPACFWHSDGFFEISLSATLGRQHCAARSEDFSNRAHIRLAQPWSTSPREVMQPSLISTQRRLSLFYRISTEAESLFQCD